MLKDEEKQKEYDKQYYLKNREKRLSQMKEWRLKNKERLKNYKKEYYSGNIENIKAKRKEYYCNNRERIIEKDKECKKKRAEHYKIQRREKCSRYYKENIQYRLRRKVKARLQQAMLNNYTSGIWRGALGCSIEELKLHLESQFKPGMTWDNYSMTGWHIDHIVALSHFDLSDPEQVKKACHYTNLQPLWYDENIRKGNKQC